MDWAVRIRLLEMDWSRAFREFALQACLTCCLFFERADDPIDRLIACWRLGYEPRMHIEPRVSTTLELTCSIISSSAPYTNRGIRAFSFSGEAEAEFLRTGFELHGTRVHLPSLKVRSEARGRWVRTEGSLRGHG